MRMWAEMLCEQQPNIQYPNNLYFRCLDKSGLPDIITIDLLYVHENAEMI